MMTPRDFEDVLDRYGGAAEAWPSHLRAEAAALLARSDGARDALRAQRDIESVLRASRRADSTGADALGLDAIAARAVRHRQVTPIHARVKRAAWAGAIAASLVFGMAVGGLWPEQQVSTERLFAGSFSTQGAIDVD